MSYIVVDNFCPPTILDGVIQSAFEAGFGSWRPPQGKVGSSRYDGMGFWGEHAVMLHSLQRHLGGPVIPNTMFFRSTNEATEKAYIHSDRMKGTSTCVVYLSDHAEEFGTAFYRHKTTGLEEMPEFADMERCDYADQLKADMVNREGFEQTGVVHGRKNRAVIFPAPLFHSRLPIHGFGTTPEDGRLVWVTHFYRLGAAGELT